MDNDVIDVTHMTAEQYKAHMKELQDYTQCPCVYCDANCDRITTKEICSKYQRWLDYAYPERKKVREK